MKRGFATIILIAFILPGLAINFNGVSPKTSKAGKEVAVIVEVKRIRSLNLQNESVYLKVFINGQDSVWWRQIFRGIDIWPEWAFAYNVVEYEENKEIPIQIELWKKGIIDQPCDISPQKGNYLYGKTLTLFYNLTSGEWHGDDWLGDASGYGHAGGHEDGNYDENDYEIWFDIYEIVSTDGWWGGSDRMTPWEKAKYGLNESMEYGNVDIDGDGIPSDWEDKYGYNPVVPEDHRHLDPDNDGLDNVEEYLTSKWLSDPFCPDVFLEIDFMEAKYPWQKDYVLPKKSQEMIISAFTKHNIILHIDDGCMGGGGDLIPFDSKMYGDELRAAREKYFLNGDPNNWRRGVFHYGIMCCQMGWAGRPAGGRMFYIDSFCVGVQYVRNWLWMLKLQGSDYETALASVTMHELGHTLGLTDFEGIDNESTRFPWSKGYYIWKNYESCMNYRYVYKLVDYSDGDDSDHDQNDWEVIKERLPRFQGDWW